MAFLNEISLNKMDISFLKQPVTNNALLKFKINAPPFNLNSINIKNSTLNFLQYSPSLGNTSS